MPFKPVVLWTDLLVFLLIGVLIAAAIHTRRREHLLAPWKKVARSVYGMCALVVLLAFLAVGLLDSLHFRSKLPGESGQVNYAPEVLSVFDLLAAPMRKKVEKTYSAPLSLHSFAKETVTHADGTQTREFPRLRHGGTHLKDSATDHVTDVARKAIGGLGLALVTWLVVVILTIATIARRQATTPSAVYAAMLRGQTDIPWRAMFVTLAVMLCVLGPALALSGHYHVMGTDKVGQDVLYQALKSIRTGLVIGTLTTLIMLPFALALGLAAGYFGGWIDDVITYLYTTLNSIPGVLLIAASILLSQAWVDRHPGLFETVTERADVRLLFLCLILGITSWTGLCRLLRGEALKLREADYVQAAHALGVSHMRIALRHLLPNVMHIVLIVIVMDFSGLVLAEAVLSYVGIGVDPSMISFGTMINNARFELAREPMVWWSLAAAFFFMFVLVLSANLFADAVRDALDPRLRSGWSLTLSRARAMGRRT